MKLTRFKLILIGVALVGIMGLILFLTFKQPAGNSGTATTSSSPANQGYPAGAELHTPNPSVPPSLTPPDAARSAITTYVQAQADRVGADMPTSSAWLSKVQPVVTSSYWAELQAASDAPAGAEYRIAHSSNYVVKANITRINWNLKQGGQANGEVYVEYSDTTTNRTTGENVSSSDLPYGWSHSGDQMPLNLKLVQQGGKWLIADDTTGADPD